MSKSRKQPIYKQRGRRGRYYHKPIRNRINNFIRTYWRELTSSDFDKQIPLAKELINDYDYCDYVSDMRFLDNHYGPYDQWRGLSIEEARQENIKYREKFSRK